MTLRARLRRPAALAPALFAILALDPGEGRGEMRKTPENVVKRVAERTKGENLLAAGDWLAYADGFVREGETIVCDNGMDQGARRGAFMRIRLDQTEPREIHASVFSKAENVGGGEGSGYSLYLDLIYADGSEEWGLTHPFEPGTHGWRKGEVNFLPRRPIRQVNFHLLLRGRTGKARFRDAELAEIESPAGFVMFDGLPVKREAKRQGGFQLRDVQAGSSIAAFRRNLAEDVRIRVRKTRKGGAVFHSGRVTDTSGRDRAVTLYFTVPVKGDGVRWLAGPRRESPAGAATEHLDCARFRAGANGLLSRFPFAAVARAGEGVAVGLDMEKPAFFRTGFSAGTGELYIAYDFGLAPERNYADFRFCVFGFDAKWGFRSALERYYSLFPRHFQRRIDSHGQWMPFHRISEVAGWEDFGFRFKEGTNETAWDDERGILTFRYTEPQTWWMAMPEGMPRTAEDAYAEARRLAGEGNVRAKAFLSSGYQDEDGDPIAQLLDTPWTDGAVWSMNSSPGVKEEPNDFGVKWNAGLREKLYGPGAAGDLDGEYVDSAEAYVTADLNFRREHFAGSRTPLTFSLVSRKPAIFKELGVHDYVQAIARDVHGMGKFMMANSTPDRICWLVPLLDVLGTETDWNRGGRWRPMADSEMLYRRSLCGKKPYCFLMNTVFEDFPKELVERYMKRCLAYGMFPGFFSHNASEGHYFSRPELFERDRPLFKRYVPLCRMASEAGWEPLTLARCEEDGVYVERFGPDLLTVFNDNSGGRTVEVLLEGLEARSCRDLVSGREFPANGGKIGLDLGSEDVALLELRGKGGPAFP